MMNWQPPGKMGTIVLEENQLAQIGQQMPIFVIGCAK